MVEQNEVGTLFLLLVFFYFDAVLEMNVGSDDTVSDVPHGKMPPFTPFCILFLLVLHTNSKLYN
jgi:hypothetical protein